MENLYSYISHYCISSIKVPSQTSLDNSLPEPLSSPPNYAMFSFYRGGLLPAPWSLKFTILDRCSFILFFSLPSILLTKLSIQIMIFIRIAKIIQWLTLSPHCVHIILERERMEAVTTLIPRILYT